MSEATMWVALRKQVFNSYQLHADRIENRAGIGTPDVSYAICAGCEGWIELKELKAWPKRLETAVKIDHYTQEQRIWAVRRSNVGGNIWFLLKVRREWLLLRGATVAAIVDSATRETLIAHAKYHTIAGLNKENFLRALAS